MAGSIAQVSLHETNSEIGASSSDELYKMVISLAERMQRLLDTSDKSEKALEVIYCSLINYNNNFMKLEVEEYETLLIRIATTPGLVKCFLTLADTLFSGLGQVQHCFWELNQSFLLWSSTMPLMQQTLVEEGLISGITFELEVFKDCPHSEGLIYVTRLAFSILCNCFQVPANVAYCMNTKCDSIVQCFTNSTDPYIRVYSIFALSYLRKKLSLDQQQALILQDKDVQFMIEMLSRSLSKEDTLLSPLSLMKALKVTLIRNEHEKCVRKFTSQGVVSVVSQALSRKDNDVRREAVLILLEMQSDPIVIEYITCQSQKLDVLQHSSDIELAKACNSVLKDVTATPQDYQAFAHDCYQFGMYERCVAACTELLKAPTCNIPAMKLLKGKSLFHICNSRIDELPTVVSPKDIPAKLKLMACIEQATEAVNLLGFAHDNHCIDDEGSMYLDVCMMFLVSSSNVLVKCQRCILCLSNLKIDKSKEKVETDPREATTQHGKQHKGLQHSHVWPKAVLEAFSSGLVKTASRRLFRMCGTETSLTQLKSPKEMTWFILCSDCEQRIGVFEEKFVRNFFKKIYDIKSPSQPHNAQDIDYGDWLYNFCISIFVRGVSLLDLPCNDYLKRFRNAAKLYELFKLCRMYLLNSPSARRNSSSLPSVHILINPTSPKPEESQMYTTIHEVLVSPAFLGLAASKDSKSFFKRPADANVFVAHIGIINVVIDIESVLTSQTHSIKPEGGVYSVPAESERDQFISPDIKEVIYVTAQQMEVHIETISEKLRTSHWAVGRIALPPIDREKTFLVHLAKKKDAENYRRERVRPAQEPTKAKSVNFLPREIRLDKHFGGVELHAGHRILLHCEHVRSRYQGPSIYSFDRGITIFLAIGDGSKNYPADQPYAIYHKYDPGMYFDMAMFVSKDDLSPTKLITDGEPKQTANMLFKNSHFQENIVFTLKTALFRIGYSNFNSYLTNINGKRSHLKCLTRSRCWYCINRCENCLKPAAAGRTVKIEGVLLKFCSEQCNISFHSNPIVLNLLPASFNLSISNGKVVVRPPSGHTMLQRVTDSFDEFEEELASRHTIRVCCGDDSEEFPRNRIYIIYEIATVLKQTVAAFFVSDDLVLKPLKVPPQECDTQVSEWFMKSIQLPVKSVLQAIVHESGFPSFPAWCSAAIQGKDSYFATLPYFEHY